MIVGNMKLQKSFERAIKKRQRDYPEYLNPKDVRLILNKAIKVIIKENYALSAEGENNG